jgi:hypothetical protein
LLVCSNAESATLENTMNIGEAQIIVGNEYTYQLRSDPDETSLKRLKYSD